MVRVKRKSAEKSRERLGEEVRWMKSIGSLSEVRKVCVGVVTEVPSR